VGQQFEHQPRPDGQVVPRPAEDTLGLVPTGVAPLAPVVDCLDERLLAGLRCGSHSLAVAHTDPLLLARCERGCGRRVAGRSVDLERLGGERGPTAQRCFITGCVNSLGRGRERGLRAGEIESWLKDDTEVDIPLQTVEFSEERSLGDLRLAVSHRCHEIREPERPALGLKRCFEDVRSLAIAVGRLEGVDRLDGKTAATAVEQSAEGAR